MSFYKKYNMTPIYYLAKYTFLYNIVKHLQYVIWIFKGNPIPPPHVVKQKIVKEYARKFKAQILIETGTYLGDMINATKKDFNQIFSVELDENLAQDAKKRFSKFNHIHILHGDSEEILPQILSEITEPCVFWLDAHYSGDRTAKGKTDTPIVHELELVLNHNIKSHVILVDDARCFNGEKDYPYLLELRNDILAKFSNLVFWVEYDIMRIHIKNRFNKKNNEFLFLDSM